MSFKSWCDEFYPVPADEVSPADAIAHSLRKWIGLREKNLAKHNCFIFRNKIGKYVTEISDDLFDSDNSVEINSESCALCVNFLAEEEQEFEKHACERCPLYKHLGRDCSAFALTPSLFGIWFDTNNPEPMIEALQATLEKQCSDA